MDDSNDAEEVAAAIEEIGVDRLTDTIATAWEQAGLETGRPTWPDDESRHRVRPPVSEEREDGEGAAGSLAADALAAVLDATPREPATVFCYLSVGRRVDLVGPERTALEALSGHADVRVDTDHTAGTIPLTGETFDAVVRLLDQVEYLLIRDDTGDAVAEWRQETLRFSVPELGPVTAALPPTLSERVERDD